MQALLSQLLAPSLRQDIGLLIIRLWFGFVLAFGHGLGKVSNLEGFSAKVAHIGFPWPNLLGPLAALSEFAGGIAFAIGLLARPAAAAILATMLTAAFVVHADDPFSKKEFALAYGMAALAVLVAGPGRFTVHRVRFSRPVEPD